MARGPKEWNEKVIKKRQDKGNGRGIGAAYIPWIEVADFSSQGRSRRVWCAKTGRTHHFFSDVEYRLFLLLEWCLDVVDIREQYPLDRELTLAIAAELGIKHPYYPRTHVPTVMTADFLVTRQRGSETILEAFNAKRDEEAEDPKSILKLEIQRAYFEQTGTPHYLVYHSQLPRPEVDNIEWIRAAQSLADAGDIGLRADNDNRMLEVLPQAMTRYKQVPLHAWCNQFDEQAGLPMGTGLAVARRLMWSRTLKPDLAQPNLSSALLGTFNLTGTPGRLKLIGDL